MTRNVATMKRTREEGEGTTVIPESPPQKRIAVQRVEESPVMNRHTDSFLDRFRSTVKSTIRCSLYFRNDRHMQDDPCMAWEN